MSQILFNVTPEMHQEIRMAATGMGLKVGPYLRHLHTQNMAQLAETNWEDHIPGVGIPLVVVKHTDSGFSNENIVFSQGKINRVGYLICTDIKGCTTYERYWCDPNNSVASKAWSPACHTPAAIEMAKTICSL